MFAILILWNFCCLAAWHLAEENQPFSEKTDQVFPGGQWWLGWNVTHSLGHQNHALEVPVYLLNMPLITVRMCCVCWLKLRENKSTLHLQSFLRSFQDHQKSRIVKGWAGFGWGRLKIWGLCISFLTEHTQELFCIPLPSLKPLKSFCPTDPFEKVWHMADVNHLQVVKPQIHQLIIQFQILLLTEVYTSFELILHLKRRFTTKYSPSRRCGSRLWEKAKFPKLCLLNYH